MIEITLHSPLLTGRETAIYLRLVGPDDDPDDVAKGVRTVKKLLRDGKLRPIQPGRESPGTAA